MKHGREVRGEQVITLQIAQQLKTKNIVVPGQLFCLQCKAKFLLEKAHCTDDQDKFQSATDTDNKFAECQHQGKSLEFHLSAYTHL